MRMMKDSGIEWIGEIPVNWNIKRVKAVLCERNESNNPIQTGKILSLTNDRGVIPYEEKGDVGNKSKEDLTGYKLAYPGDIVLNSMNVFIGSVGLSSYFGCVSPVYYMLYPRNKNDSVGFFNYLFQTKELQTKLHGYGNGIMEIRMRIQMSKLNSVQLPVPPSDVQQKIADYLDRKCSQIKAIIARQQEVIEKLKAYKLSIITEVVTKGLNPDTPMKDSGVEWIGKIPDHWEVMRFGRCATIKSNLVAPGDYTDYPQISPDSIEKSSGRILEYKTVKESGVISWNHLFFKGQIIYSKIRPMLNKVTIAPFDGLCSADMYPIETNNNTQFLVYMMLSDYFTSQVGLVTENRVKMPKINQNELGAIMVTIPPQSEQETISKYLLEKCSSIDDIIDTANADPMLYNVRTNVLDDSKQLEVVLNDRLIKLYHLDSDNVNSNISIAWGGKYVNDFIDRGRIKKVYVQSMPQFRSMPEDLSRLYFKNDELAKTEIEYPRGYYLTERDINSFNTDRLKYDVPSLIGDGYFSFTFFTTSFNEDTGFSTDFLEPGTLNHDLVIHFGIYG